jgi:hypothetical protein
MLYLGFFFAVEQSPRGVVADGEFTVLVDADDAEKALEEFEKKILELRREGDTFSGNCTIHLKSIVGFERVPEKAVALHCRKFAWYDGSLVSYHKAFLSRVPEGCEVYSAPEGREENEGACLDPFLEFNDNPGRHLRVIK